MWIYYLLFISIFMCNAQVSKDNSDCACVMYYLCDQDNNNTIIVDGKGLIDERAGFPKCDIPGQLCCPLPKHIRVPTTLTTSTVPTVITPSVPTVPTDPTKAPEPKSSCGKRNPDGVGHRTYNINSEKRFTEFGEFPWMVAILKGKNATKGIYRCGGSLIHPSVVLTAAHCVLDEDQYIVRAGEWDSSNTEEIFPYQNRQVSSKKIHEDFIMGIYHNDIALLFLDSPFDLKLHIDVVCLPPANTTATGRCFTAGWGRSEFGQKGKFPVILKKLDLPMVPRDKCQADLRKTRLGPFFYLHPSFVCAGGEEGNDVCVGDGGGPLVCPIDEEESQYQQIGIVAWGIGCGTKDVPGVYANVPTFREWIEKQMSDNNYDL